jgi:hypothetical protein
MSEAIDRSQSESTSGTGESRGIVHPGRWTRTHTIWLLLALSLSPGAAAAAAREWWGLLPAGVRLSAYILSGIMLFAACSLIFLQEDAPTRNDP